MYTKPTVTKLGSVTEKTQGGWNWVVVELLSRRSGAGGGG